MENETDILVFMQKFSFATIISSENDLPIATHLPSLIEKRGDKIFLLSHFAKANSQWQNLEKVQNLVIFSEPHAYISPRFYEKDLNVPTWNYMAIHAYGKARIFTKNEEVLTLLEKLIKTYEENYFEQWQSLPEKYKEGMMAGIVAFEIEVTDLQAKAKLSQNRSKIEHENIVKSFEKSEDYNEKMIGEYMKQN